MGDLITEQQNELRGHGSLCGAQIRYSIMILFDFCSQVWTQTTQVVVMSCDVLFFILVCEIYVGFTNFHFDYFHTDSCSSKLSVNVSFYYLVNVL